MSAAPVPAAAPPAWVEILIRQAEAARTAGRTALATAIYRRVAAAAPEHAAAALQLGLLLNAQGLGADAEAVLRRAVALAPQAPAARYALACALLGQGRYREAGAFHRARFELPATGCRRPPALPFPEWAGENLAGKRLIVFPEAGFGEQIQAARFVGPLRDQGAQVWLLCRPELARLFAASLPGVQVIAARGELDLPETDYWTTSGSLMFAAGATPESLPAAPYLRAPAGSLPLPAGFKVGLMTAGDPAWSGDADRSLPPAEAERLRAALPGEVFDLAPAASGARDFADTALLVEGLDLVVTVDTAAAHLAGALGKPTFLLLPHANCDWRWLHGREDSCWYPTARLYRAAPREDWTPALERLARDAHGLAAN